MKTDINIQKELGKRIRDRRKKQGLTQAQLCGDYMTRNMLSKIETGDASPSLDTLFFIAKKLKCPPAYFLCRDSKEEAEYSKIVRVKEARRALGTEQYKKCVDICKELPSDDDEISFMLLTSNVQLAISHFDKGELSEAISYLDSASSELHSTIYMYSEMLSQIRLLRLLIDSLTKGKLPSKNALESSLPVFFTKDRYLYICALSSGKTELPMSDIDSHFSLHLVAKKAMNEKDYVQATMLLEKALKKSNDCFSEFFIITDLEKCAKALEDYKQAYEYAHTIMELKAKYTL